MGPFLTSLMATAIGIVVVVGLLCVIVFVVVLMNNLIQKFSGKKKAKEQPAEVIVSDEVVPTEGVDKKKLVAVITAALTISAFSGTNARFIVKKIKRL